MENYMKIIIAIVIVVLIWYISTSNSMKRLLVKIDESNSGIDVSLEKRHDVLVKMRDAVKGMMKHEKETLTEVVQYRKGLSINEMSEMNKEMNSQFEQIYAMAEQYPEIKAGSNFLELQAAITDTEEHLQAARRVYNSNVSIYNQKIVVFPNNIVANAGKFTAKEFFKAEEFKRKDVSLEF